MKLPTNRRKFLGLLGSSLAWLSLPSTAQNENPQGQRKKHGQGGGLGHQRAQDYVVPPELAAFSWLSLVLGRATDKAITVSAVCMDEAEGFYEYGMISGNYVNKTATVKFVPGKPVETVFTNLRPGTQYFYRLQHRKPGQADFTARPEGQFHTQRAAGSTFSFTIQGDSHPERPQMSEPNLYARTLQNAAKDKPDFHICMGDDFSVAPVRTVDWPSITARYTLQRPFLGIIGQLAPVFLLNGNHEQASLFNFDQADERHMVAVFAQNARNLFYPMPAPDGFYSGDTEPLNNIGLRKDYCAWTWGDALFVILDNYWHSPAQVDSGFREQEAGGGKGGGRGQRDWWALTLGDAQYEWFKRMLESSQAKYKFVFAHHVMGSGRGGIDQSEFYEWGGYGHNGIYEFMQFRPGWELPVHQLMVKHGVTIFFQGHDHLYCQQQRDGIIYQEVPMPADHGYVAYNDDSYQSGVKLPNSGHLRVTVSPENVKVKYIRSFLPKDENAQNKTGEIAHSYTVKPKVSNA